MRVVEPCLSVCPEVDPGVCHAGRHAASEEAGHDGVKHHPRIDELRCAGGASGVEPSRELARYRGPGDLSNDNPRS